jgi:hypothetical protein
MYQEAAGGNFEDRRRQLPGDNNNQQYLFDLPEDRRAGIHVIEPLRMVDGAKQLPFSS